MKLKFLAAAAAMSAALCAAPISIFGTGGGLVNPAVDPNWTLVSGPLGSGTLTVIADDDPIFSYWSSNGPTARWVSPSGAGLNAPPGDYSFMTTFDLTGFLESTASLSGTYFADDTVTDILINGVSLGISGGDYVNPTAFTINCSIFCIAGVNTLEFMVTNSYTFDTPFGLMVDISGTADSDPAAVPEPSTLAMLGAGCTLFGFVRVRKRKKP
jgi:hypothetical protein